MRRGLWGESGESMLRELLFCISVVLLVATIGTYRSPRLESALSTGTVLTRADDGSRTMLAALSLVLAIVGATFSLAPVHVFDLLPLTADGSFYTGILAAWCLPPAIGVLLRGRRVQRWACLLGTVVTSLVFLVLLPYFGFYQLPSVVALGLAVTNRRIVPEGSSWWTKIGRIVLTVVCVYVCWMIATIVVRIVLSL